LSHIGEITDFELAMIDSLLFATAVGQQQIFVFTAPC